ncbi:hypothetical protein CJT92_30570 [Pseudomonas aeruginosa]|nr:hypothetical protein CJT92_30570 [Pseudomonas aeruginosa]
MAGNGAQDCGARHAGGTVNPDSNDERPAGCRSPVGERGSNTDFTGWPSNEGQTGSQHALEGKTMNSKNVHYVDNSGTNAAGLFFPQFAEAYKTGVLCEELADLFEIEILKSFNEDGTDRMIINPA